MTWNEVRFGRQADGDVRRVPTSTALDVFDVEVVLPFGHTKLRIAMVRRQPVHEQVIAKSQLRQSDLDRSLHVALHRADGVPAARRMYVIVDDWKSH